MNLIAILGQTSSGKSELAVQLAKKLGRACVINCDSRQIYRGLNVGTGKVEGHWDKKMYFYKNIEHFLIDSVNPETQFALIDYLQAFVKLIPELETKYDTIILSGGTGFWAKAILEKVELGFVKAQFDTEYQEFKRKLQSKTITQLQNLVGAKILNQSDFQNPYRLVSHLLRQESIHQNWLSPIQYPNFESTKAFVIQVDQEVLKQKIKSRLVERVSLGIVEETEKILYLGRDRIWQLGLEYRLSWCYLHGLITQTEYENKLVQENLQYAKRQLTWLKKQDYIIWKTTQEILDQSS